jgi:tetratricopeptide (TPR) repeat protein
MRQPSTYRALVGVAMLLALLVLPLGGCSSGQAPKDTDYVKQYDSGQYAASLETAGDAAGKLSGGNREQAALIAGLSAQALNRNAEAQRWLTPLVPSSDPNIGGRAGAALGLIAKEEGKNEEAARLLSDAGDKLSGDEAARAYVYAGDALRAQGRVSDATGAYLRAREKVASDGTLRVMINDRLRTGGPPSGTSVAGSPPTSPSGKFTVQAGAFLNRKSAEQRAAQLRSKGPSRVVEILGSKGQRLYAVRIGRYATKPDAEIVRRSVGAGAIVTIASNE